MSKYLYGAAVQGIQGFIFSTNRLKEIVGGSELVEQICTQLFARTLYPGDPDPVKKLEGDPNAILNAAGNIKYVFDSEEECRRVVRIFPKKVMEFAPGVTVSQSVVEMTPGHNFEDDVQALEKNLRSQRNRPMRDLSTGLTATLRSRETGLPVTHIRPAGKGTEYLDSATYHKLFDEQGKRKETFKVLCEKAFDESLSPEVIADPRRWPLDINDMTGRNDWIAIIHADGNGLGLVVQKTGSDPDKFRTFSRRLDNATAEAADRAFKEVILPVIGENDYIPMRPIVLGGDDLTVICRADLAIPFTEAFLRHFEECTHKHLGDILLGKKPNGKYGSPVFADKADRLTACAGIAFIKSSFPFHFGYRLAESLCDRAKKDTKAIFNATAGNLPASCLMFHKVQDSFVTDFADISERELSPGEGVSFEFGPYYLDKAWQPDPARKEEFDARWTIDTLIRKSEILDGKEGNAVRSGIRHWMTLLHDNPGMAEQRKRRILSIVPRVTLKEYVWEITDPAGERKAIPAYDILTLHTLNNQTTK